jgi:PAS domain-containing protein
MNEDQGNSRLGEPSAESQLTGCRHQVEKIAFENKMLRAVLDSMPDNISIKDLQGRYIFDTARTTDFSGQQTPRR